MVDRQEYEKVSDYLLAKEIIKNFIADELEGDINNFKEFDFTNIKNQKYIGNIADPDMYLITQAIYIVLWGDIWDLSFKNMGSWGKSDESQYPYRGDTIYAFGKIGEKKGKEFGYRAKYFGLDKNQYLWEEVKVFYQTYHRLGNFIVIPNRGKKVGGINTARADWINGMRDYFDWFLITIYNYQMRRSGNEEKVIREFEDAFVGRISFEELLDINPEYAPDYLGITKWKDIFFLDSHFKGQKPTSFFVSSPKDRKKITTYKAKRLGADKYYNENEYALLLDEYIRKSSSFIDERTEKMIGKLNELV